MVFLIVGDADAGQRRDAFFAMHQRLRAGLEHCQLVDIALDLVALNSP
jgi:hypothetical protein